MDLKTYKKEVQRTFAYRKEPLNEHTTDCLHCAIGFATECSELIEAINKKDYTNVKEEIADGLWYIFNLAVFVGVDIENFQFINDLKGRSEKILLDERNILSGDLLDIFKKHIFYNKQLFPNSFDEIIGKIMENSYYFCCLYGIKIEDICERNIAKLKVRFPEKFTEELAENRDLDSEKLALEGFENRSFGEIKIGEEFKIRTHRYKKHREKSAKILSGNYESETTIDFEENEIVQIKKQS